MDGATEYNAKQNNSVRERQKPYDFTHIQNLRHKTKTKQEEKERETNQETDC